MQKLWGEVIKMLYLELHPDNHFLCAALHPEAHFEPRPTHINVLLSKLKNLGTYKLHSEN